ncbi:MAG: TlpA family protein disulfide reductase [Phaeodactylibacter sp.]|nr:TlpA family protein disulfide reductase [Phaeodactylibacter sp.]MCB9299181.1 TlpA family protein disulfide reductase [Lewinellaceae bacterium]HQU60293.1 TlpA disulfide reductase family protein [Saprospiraceae bacterium]
MRILMKFFPHATPLLYGLALLFFSCNAQPEATGQSQQQFDTAWPAPDSILQGIPIYATFDRIEPLFHIDNDTTYIINFWATWCAPCVAELPYFDQLVDAYQGQKVKVILVSLDFPRQFETKLAPFVRERQLKPTVVALADGHYNDWIDKVSTEWSGAIPATLVYKGDKTEFIGNPVHAVEDVQAVVERVQ